MQYWVILNTKEDRIVHHHEAYLPGVRVPVRIEELLTSKWVDENYPEWCKTCELAYHPHPIRPDGSKFCTVLLQDAVKPGWKIKDLA